jgi:hypothetical protein
VLAGAAGGAGGGAGGSGSGDGGGSVLGGVADGGGAAGGRACKSVPVAGGGAGLSSFVCARAGAAARATSEKVVRRNFREPGVAFSIMCVDGMGCRETCKRLVSNKGRRADGALRETGTRVAKRGGGAR